MNKKVYKEIESYMLEKMSDSAHDREHVYRVLYNALDIASFEKDADIDIIITSCLLHDIGRDIQFANPKLCHAVEGGKLAYSFLIEKGWTVEKAEHVKACITTHRFRSDNPPASIEAKILFDADKVDVTGAIGIARTLMFEGRTNCVLYINSEDGKILEETSESCFVKEFNYKLNNLYKSFYTERASVLANQRKKAAEDYYNSLVSEVKSCQEKGIKSLENILEN